MSRFAIMLARLLAVAPITAALSLSAGCATTPGSLVGQFDFQYSASGAAEVRPYQVFDDGAQTFLQFDHPLPANAQIFISVPSGQLPQALTRNGELVSVPSIANGLTIVAGTARASVAYRGKSHATRYDVRSPLAAAPAGTQSPAAATAPVPDQTLAAVPIAPSGAGTNDNTGPTPASASPRPAVDLAAVERKRPTLQSAFGIERIEAGPDGTTRLIFTNPPDPTLMVVDQRGYPLDPVWLAKENALIVRPVDQLRITTPEFSFDVARVSGVAYRYDATLGLKKVFDERGSTYFAFDHVPRHLKITDGQGRGRGWRRGAYYRYRGTRDHYQVTLDGTTFDVTRASIVRFYARERS
ncbi:TrbG/VirB9 family P-type conjugative transfer protein [Burkholderia gladioli]|uniref:TrbG/VirB9 family P-type conjugative transfer protein n=1 Tax=Burkholderia gladioli TaxID=28095 RepID=UPI0034DB2C5B